MINTIQTYSIRFLMISALTGAFLAGPNATSGYDAAAGEEMTLIEVEALLRHRIKGVAENQIPGIARHLIITCREKHFSPYSVLSVIAAESSFNINARSHVGALGLMQLMPETAKYIAKREGIHAYRRAADLRDPKINITIGVSYLNYLRAKFGSSHKYLAAYNMGPNKFRKVMNSGRIQKNGPVAKYVRTIHAGVRPIQADAKRLAARRLASSDAVSMTQSQRVAFAERN